MNKTISIIRAFFLLLAFLGSLLVWYTGDGLGLVPVLVVGMSIAALVVLTDILVEGFSLRGLTAVTFGLAVGALIAFLLSSSPLFNPLEGDKDLSQIAFLARLVVFVVSMYLATVIALRGKDEFNLVIPYVRFSPQRVEAPTVVVDTSALIDGRIVAICESRWFAYTLVIPRFVLRELQAVADSGEELREAKGRRGLEALNSLRELKFVELRIHESDVERAEDVDSKLVFLAKSMNARLLTTDVNLAKLAQFQDVDWLNITDLVTALTQEATVGSSLVIKLVRPGKEAGQAVGYLNDGAMVVVGNAQERIGERVHVEVDSVVPSSGGKMLFASLSEEK